MIVTDAEGNISFVNEAACGLFGLARDECMGKLLSERISGLDWNSLARSETVISRDMEIFYPQQPLPEFLRDPDLAGEKRGRDRTQIPHAAKSRAKPAPRQASRLVGFAIILRDITETRRSTEQTIESERLNALTLLAAGVAHEIGNPLNSLNIHLQLLERKLRRVPEDLRADLEASVRIAKEEITRLDYIITQFLRAIRPAPLETTLENLNALVQESLAFLAPELKDRDILVETDYDESLPPLRVDRHQIKQVFYNVIKNAAQAMKAGGIFHIRTSRDEDHVSATFIDTGGGIPAEAMSKVFDPYFTTKEAGSGLGLLIVRRIVREHGGEIDIVNREGSGVALTIRLPIRERHLRMLGGGDAGQPAAGGDRVKPHHPDRG